MNILHQHPVQTVTVGSLAIGIEQPLTVIAGPCVAESFQMCLAIGQAMRDRCDQLGLGYIFKASFDKANRSSIHSGRGPGLEEGLALLEKIKRQLGVPVTTDVHESSQVEAVAQVVDLIQVPAFLCRQTDLLLAVAATGKPVNVKKGQFMSPAEMGNVIRKLRDGKKEGQGGGIVLTERGTFFGYHRLVNDFVGLGDLMDLGWPVCFDVTHSTQMPGDGDQGVTSGGRPECAPLLGRCAVAAGVQVLFLETHPDPSKAVSDTATMLPLSQSVDLLGQWAALYKTVHAG